MLSFIKISIEQRDTLFEITKSWFNDTEKVSHNRIGTLLIRIFIDSEKDQFDRRLNDIIPSLVKQLNKNNFDEVSHLPTFNFDFYIN